MEMVSAVRRAAAVKRGCRDEQSPGGTVWVETAGEGAYLGLSDGLGPALGLDVEPVNAEGVLVDDAVYASVSGAS